MAREIDWSFASLSDGRVDERLECLDRLVHPAEPELEQAGCGSRPAELQPFIRPRERRCLVEPPPALLGLSTRSSDSGRRRQTRGGLHRLAQSHREPARFGRTRLGGAPAPEPEVDRGPRVDPAGEQPMAGPPPVLDQPVEDGGRDGVLLGPVERHHVEPDHHARELLLGRVRERTANQLLAGASVAREQQRDAGSEVDRRGRSERTRATGRVASLFGLARDGRSQARVGEEVRGEHRLRSGQLARLRQ